MFKAKMNSLTEKMSGEPQSLEYIEDPYFTQLEGGATPSLDEPDYNFGDDDEITVHCWTDDQGIELETELYLRSLTLDQILIDNSDLDDSVSVETEFITKKVNTKLKVFNKTKKAIEDVRVTFQDLSKPYLVKISNHQNYRKFLDIVGAGAEEATPNMADLSPGDSGVGINELAGLTPEEVERQRAEWSQELARVEEEIATLRTVLASKVRLSGELKRKLGVSVWKEITEDMNQGIKNVKESNVYCNVENRVGQIAKAVTEAPIYQKTESVLKTTAEKTSTLFGGITAGVSSKLGQMRNSESFRSIEERVGNAYENVKTKVSTSRSSSMQSFDEALRESHKSPVTSPTIPENPIGKS